MANPISTYPSYSYVVSLVRPGGSGAAVGGFAAASGLAVPRQPEALPFGFRRAGGQGARALKISGINKTGDVTLKRGMVNSSSLWNWMNSVRGFAADDVLVTQRNAAGVPLNAWKLSHAKPKKYSGPTLGGKGGSDTAIEELVLSADRVEIVPPK